MTQSTGATEPQQAETTAPADEKTVTIQDLCARWEIDPAEAAELQKFIGQTGPWTEPEAAELDRRMSSFDPADLFPGYQAGPSIFAFPAGKVGPHGPGCECGDLTPEEMEVTDALADKLTALLMGALGRTPAETRTGTSDAEAAILDALGHVQDHVGALMKGAGGVGMASTYISNNQDVVNATEVLLKETEKVRRSYRALRDIVTNVAAWVPQVRGKQATDAEGLPIWFLPATVEPSAGWLTTAQAESPGENWKAVYVH